MTPRRRLAVVTAVVLASFAGSGVAAQASVSTASSPENGYGDWVCVGIETIDYGYCQGNPLPKRLPLPEDRPRI